MKVHRLLFLTVVVIVSLTVSPSDAKKARASDGWPRVFNRGPLGPIKYVALTFDDAPTSDTIKLLDILDDCGVHATFFLEGSFVSVRPEIAREIVNRGHEIGNHTYDHPDLTKINIDNIRFEIEATNQTIEDLLNVRPHLFRPPGGNFNKALIDIAYQNQLTTVLWTVNSADYRIAAVESIVDRIIAGMYPGAIILLHDGLSQTRDVVPDLVKILKQKGYVFITVGEMINMVYGPSKWEP